MSKTERDLSSDGGVDAFDELFADTSFDEAFDEAIEDAELDLDADDADSADADADATDESAESAEVADDEIDGVDEGDDAAADDVDADDELIDDDETQEVAAVVADADETDRDDVDAELDDDPDAELDEPDAELDDDPDAELDDGAELDDDPDAELDDGAGLDDDPDAELDESLIDEDAPAAVVTTTGADADTEIHAETDTGIQARESGDPGTDDDVEYEDVSDDILEELRRADIDGPVVPYAPQDDTTASVRRPRRSADYDPAPVPIPAKVPRVLGRKPRVRKVTRVVRHVDPWSVFKIAIVAHLVLYVIVLTASVLLWNVANATGTVDNVERFFESFGWNSFEFNGGELYHAGWIAGLFVVIGLTGLAVLAATLFNLITDLVGGVRFTVLEEEVLETRTSPMRRFVVRRSEPEVPALLNDSTGAMYREAVVDDTGANHRPTR